MNGSSPSRSEKTRPTTSPSNGAGHDLGHGEGQRTDLIFQVAARIFSERGFHAASINEIAEAVQLTKAGLYYYIKGKQDLLYRIMDYAMVAIEEHVIAVARRESDPSDRLRTVLYRHSLLVTQKGSAPFALLVDELSALEDEQRAGIASRQKLYVDFIRGILEELRAAELLRPGTDTLTTTYGLLGMVLWTSRWFREGGRLDSSAVAEQITALGMAGVLAAP